MGDDPYDFDIAIPGGKEPNGGAYGGGGSGWGGAHSSGASDSDAESSSDADASDVSVSSDSDGKGRRHRTNGRTTAGGGGGGVGLRGAGPVAKGGGGGGGSTALDKAKSFLSKYSSKATPATPAQSSGRSRQLEMSLDDDEFSLDSSGDSARKPTASRKSASRQGRSSASEEEDDDAKSGRSNEPHSDDDESTSSVANPPVAGVESARILQASSRNSDSVNPRPVSTAAASGSVPTTMAWRPSSTVEKTSVSADDDDEIESVASQSDEGHSDSVDAQRAAPASACATVAIPAGTAVSVAASESGVYEDEDFEEGSTNHAPSLHPTVRLEAEAAETPSKEDEEESHVHYSLDFMEDGDAPGMTDSPRYDPPTPRAPRDADRRSTASSSTERNKDSYVEEDSDGDHTDKQETDHGQATTPADDPQRIPSVETAKAANDESEEYDQDARFESESAVNMPMSSQHNEPDPCVADKIGTRMHPTAASTARSSPIIVGTAQPSQASQPLTCEVRERPRPRVQIIREYEQERGSVDKKDASTQFTGNHASIQTDVTPHGMLTGTEQRLSRDLPASIANEQTIELPSDRHGLSYVSPPAMSSEVRQAEPPMAPPPPPPSAFTSYGLYDPLQLPTDVSMSIYKQQLLSLQQQIHQKKLETERLFRERISTRYTSLRGTERFLTSNRPSRMPLWEALLRIDPSLDEAKAKEIARMASDGAA